MEKRLYLKIQPKVIDHLGIKMYQKPVDVIAEYIANAWDADSEEVSVILENIKITVSDKGDGMTFNECQDCYLQVGRDRREVSGKDTSNRKERPVLGRKGIGKFAGFGVAKTITVDTISRATGEKTVFKMDIDSILEYDVQKEDNKIIEVVEYCEPDEYRKENHGTTIILERMDLSFGADLIDNFKKELSRRFLLTQFYDDFVVLINDEPLPHNFNDEMEFVFPRDLTEDEKNKFPKVTSFNNNGWAVEDFDEFEIKWRIGFYEEPIKVEELRGIGVYVKGKLAQKPFFFDLTGGISAQNSLEYMTGQVQMDFIDTGENNLISTERQRINLQTELGKKIKVWGIEKIKEWGSIWKSRRSEKRLADINDKISGFRNRLDALPRTERRTVETVLKKIATFDRLGQARFKEWCADILTSWEKGRLRNIITELAEQDELDETQFIEILSEADVLTALNIAESVKTKIVAIGELKERVKSKELENKVRDYIYEHPWLIHPKWETYRKERSVEKLIKDIADKELKVDVFQGRVDLVLSSGQDLLLVEFMRPGLSLDRDHLDRINYYVMGVRRELAKQTGLQFRHVDSAYVIADNKNSAEDVTERILQLQEKKIFVLTWESLISQALKQWGDYLDLIKLRNPEDIRIQEL
ncbi:ATP-binding protein [Proteiniphilum sp. X52]|uniref:ATP-binding protein n=1 Tax=Proteiniphilum sp. X52 TaxID=2382159 RepID=UPI000F0A25B4|nr:ATP-binding protein [Proteiniphilum sp. X52]RNC64468.1 hypothetical protein D7D25_11220 [Proteiniphilum sp. X52]